MYLLTGTYNSTALRQETFHVMDSLMMSTKKYPIVGLIYLFASKLVCLNHSLFHSTFWKDAPKRDVAGEGKVLSSDTGVLQYKYNHMAVPEHCFLLKRRQ